MDRDTDTISATGNVGLESIPENDNGSTAEPVRLTGAIDPDAARATGDIGTGTDDFTAAFSDTGNGDASAELTPTGRIKRRRGPNKQPREGKEASLNINGVEKILFSIHAVAAAITKTPELELDESESKKLAKSIEGVTDQYKLTLDPKVAAYIDLVSTVGMIYGPRAVSIYVRRKAERAKLVQQNNTGNVTPIRPEHVQPAPQQQRQQPTMSGEFDPTKQTPFNG